MKTVRWFGVVALAVVAAPAAWSQEGPKPGPEHEFLKKHVGVWDLTMKAGGFEIKGVVTYKMDLGGLWLVSEFEGEFSPGQKFSGRGLDSYDRYKKKYVSVWVDSMAASPVVSEGNYDKEGKVLSMIGEGPGEDGKPTKYKMVTEHQDKDNMVFTMFGLGPDGKETKLFAIAYKRRK